MTATEVEPEAEQAAEPVSRPIVVYSPTDAAIAKLKSEFSPLISDPDAAKTPEGYKAVTKAIATVRPLRTGVESLRVELKREHLERGRLIDSEAKRITGLLLEIEEPLKAAKAKVDDERERIAREKAEAEKAALEAQQRAAREAEEARLKAIRDAEAEKLRAEREEIARQRAEFERQQAEEAERRRAIREEEDRQRAVLEEGRKAEQQRVAEEQRKERERIDAENRKLQERERAIAEEARIIREAKEKADREEFERTAREEARVKAEKEAAERAERQRAEAERRAAEEARLAKIRAEEEAAEARRVEEAKPDVDKVRQFGRSIRALLASAPKVSKPEAVAALASAESDLLVLADRCEAFAIGRRPKARA